MWNNYNSYLIYCFQHLKIQVSPFLKRRSFELLRITRQFDICHLFFFSKHDKKIFILCIVYNPSSNNDACYWQVRYLCMDILETPFYFYTHPQTHTRALYAGVYLEICKRLIFMSELGKEYAVGCTISMRSYFCVFRCACVKGNAPNKTHRRFRLMSGQTNRNGIRIDNEGA